ncbi:hypothetical protein KY309_03740 [Candidatus Woesearchaeota archaeon]|nr:hypothetical protein [Candidatus Woesearchaeota archaeon]MBW3016694.1 hypothetical protein [Candidatus Woesearchaeota archaeon]
MKRIALFVLLIALFAIGATAIQVSSPSIGGESQDRVANIATTFTITNNNTGVMSGITVSFGSGAEQSKYALSYSGIPQSLAAGAQAVISINGTIPLDHPAVDSSDLKEKALKIGTVTVSGTVNNAAETAVADVFMQAVNQLKIKKVRIECGDKTQSLDSGDRVKNLKPGESCSMEIQVENNFDDDDRNNQKIGDIAFDSIDVRVDSSNSDIDVDEDDSLDDLDADDEDAVNVDLDIDEEADDGTISLDIRVSGRDENGALHGEQMDVKLEVNRLTHDVQLRRIDLSPSVVSSCDATNVKVTVNVLNQGKRDEDEAAVEVSIPELKFTKKVENIELDRDESTTVSVDVPIAKGAKEGVLRVDVNSFFDSIAPSNSGSVDLIVEACEEEIIEEPVVNKTTSVVIPQTQPVVVPPGQAQAAPKKDSSFSDSKAYVALLAVLSLLIAIVIIGLVVLLVRKKN